MRKKLQTNYFFSFLLIILSLLFIRCGSPVSQKTDNDKKPENLSAKEIYKKSVNNTVTIVTEKALGSGFFIDSNKIITNYHVIEGSDKAQVILNDTEKKCSVLGFLAIDKLNDLVLLQIDCANHSFIAMEDNIPQPGEKVFAIGSPVGLSKTISEGMISGIRAFGERKLLQITAPISHGSSGCPIINEKGKLVGVAVGEISDASSVGFCIPINFIKTLIDFKENYSKELSVLLSKKNNKNSTQIENKSGGKSIEPDPQRWATENLSVSRFSNGDIIPEIKTAEEWERAGREGKPAWCYYDNDPSNGKKYGKLYNWYAINDARGLAPDGWHIPSDEDWSTLTNYLGASLAGTKMKSTSGWNKNGNGTNTSHFSALPGGWRNTYGAFGGVGDIGQWWTATESSATLGSVRDIFYKEEFVFPNHWDKACGYSVRCIMN